MIAETHEKLRPILEQGNVLMIGVGTVAVVLAFMNRPQLSGMTHALIGPLQGWLGSVHGRRRRELSALSVKTAAAA